MNRAQFAIIAGAGTITIIAIIVIIVMVNRETEKPRNDQKRVRFSPKGKQKTFKKEDSPSNIEEDPVSQLDLEEDPVTFIDGSILEHRPEMSVDRFTQKRQLHVPQSRDTTIGPNPNTININPIPTNFLRKRESITPLDI